MPVQRLEGLPSAYDAGDSAGDYLSKAADAAADAACALYRDHPGFVLPPDVFNLAPSVVNASRGIWDSLCGGRVTLPPPPTKPYTGGQCVGTPYNVTRSIDANVDDPNPPSVATFGTVGKIGSLSVRTNANGSKTWFLPTRIGTPGGQVDVPIFTAPADQADKVRVSIIGVAPTGSNPNNCGDPPPQFPPTVPPPSATGGDTTITNNDGTDITVPFAYIPVTISPEFSPQIRVDLGGLNFRFDLGGVDVQFPELAPSPPNTPSFPDSGGSKPDCPPCNCPDSDTEPPSPGTNPPETPPGGGDDKDAPGVTYLEVRLTNLPNKVQSGNSGEDIYYAGWVSFRSATGYYYPREPIHFQRSVFKAPSGCNGYTITYTNQAQGVERFYTEDDTPT